MIHQNGGIFSGFSLTKFHYHELVATFAKHDDFIMKHTDSMYKNAVIVKKAIFGYFHPLFLRQISSKLSRGG